jgi:peptidyl-prolyl cis-trans isomerase C
MRKASARHILVNTEEACAALKQDIEAGADFAQVARQHSECPSSRHGGELGEFGPGQMVKEFDEVVFSAPVGEVQGPVKTQFGYHLVEVTHRTD